MRKVILLVGVVLALAVLVPGSARTAVGGTDLPFHGAYTGTSTLNLQTGQVHNSIAGELTHLGTATNDQDGYLIPTGAGTFHLVITNWTTTSANGDQISGTCDGTVTTTDGVHFTSSATCVSNGGTGRFEHASVIFTVQGQSTRVSVENGVAHSVVEGMIDGSLGWR